MDNVRGARLITPLGARMKVGVIVLHLRASAMDGVIFFMAQLRVACLRPAHRKNVASFFCLRFFQSLSGWAAFWVTAWNFHADAMIC